MSNLEGWSARTSTIEPEIKLYCKICHKLGINQSPPIEYDESTLKSHIGMYHRGIYK